MSPDSWQFLEKVVLAQLQDQDTNFRPLVSTSFMNEIIDLSSCVTIMFLFPV
jgi:hypothetical protein